MALTLTKQLRVAIGDGLLMAVYQVTHDEATSTFTAASVGFNRFKAATRIPMYTASSHADLSTFVNNAFVCSIVAGTKGEANKIEMALPPKVGAKDTFILFGW